MKAFIGPEKIIINMHKNAIPENRNLCIKMEDAFGLLCMYARIT